MTIVKDVNGTRPRAHVRAEKAHDYIYVHTRTRARTHHTFHTLNNKKESMSYDIAAIHKTIHNPSQQF